jgi:hypothetical protein
MCIPVLLTPAPKIYSSFLHRSMARRWTDALHPVPHRPALPGHYVALSAGPWEKPSSQLVCCPGPSMSGFPALHNLSISAKYICHFPLSGD